MAYDDHRGVLILAGGCLQRRVHHVILAGVIPTAAIRAEFDDGGDQGIPCCSRFRNRITFLILIVIDYLVGILLGLALKSGHITSVVLMIPHRQLDLACFP